MLNYFGRDVLVNVGLKLKPGGVAWPSIYRLMGGWGWGGDGVGMGWGGWGGGGVFSLSHVKRQGPVDLTKKRHKSQMPPFACVSVHVCVMLWGKFECCLYI